MASPSSNVGHMRAVPETIIIHLKCPNGEPRKHVSGGKLNEPRRGVLVNTLSWLNGVALAVRVLDPLRVILSPTRKSVSLPLVINRGFNHRRPQLGDVL